MTRIHAQETDPQTRIDGTRSAKKDGTKMIVRGKGKHLDEIKAQLLALQDEEKYIIKLNN